MAKFITLDNLATFKTKLETLFAKQSAITKAAVGLDNVTNDAQVKRSEMGVANGVATLDTSGKVPSSQLPAYVDDVLEYDNKTKFPATGEAGKIYVANDTNLTYRWSGTAYVEISPSLAIGTTSSTAAAGNHNHDSVYYKKTDTVANATNAVNATKATQDGDGKVISETYYKKTDTVDHAVSADRAVSAASAANDGAGLNISSNYYKKTDTVANATNAVNATKATQDGDGKVISTTYAKNAFSFVKFSGIYGDLDEQYTGTLDAMGPADDITITLGDGLKIRTMNHPTDGDVIIQVMSATTDEIEALFA